MTDWLEFWEGKAGAGNDFQASGRGLMDVAGYLYTIAEVVRLLDLQQGESLADIGCGTGLITLSLAPWLGEIHAFDISPALAKRSADNLAAVRNVSVEVGSLTAIPLAAARVDKLLAYSVLQYLGSEDDVIAALSEVSRVLKRGGKALLAANPDPVRRHRYEDIVRARGDQAAAACELSLLEHLLWLPADRYVELAVGQGLRARMEPISERIWQHFYMFDLVLEKVE
jgi:ubiquinone/menaquinone biosynthesis C-methylase UbiE